SGSVLVTGTNFKTMTFHVYVRGDGGASVWPTGNTSGDGFMIGVSLLTVNSVLPLSITDFTATPDNTSAQLQWNAAAGGNSSFFDVESSKDGTTWQDIGMVIATDDNNTTYTYTDPNAAAGNNFYRIKEINAAGNAVYSPVKTVYIDVQSTTTVFPNPVRNRLCITGNGSTIRSVVVTAADGKEMARYTGPVAGNSIDMSSLPGGMYFVTIGYASGSKQTTAIVKY
ncbi:MAG TPA: T9SS type A sorting domain-containing protein, partial [Puia sp.]|nr:T9SS type A sorting domain-containing protein [Puia sp.]